MKLLRFQVDGYKNFTRPVALEALGSINILHGDNNVGKSNLLEAMHLFFRLLSKAGSGEKLPFKPVDVSAADFLDRTGHEPAFIFNVDARAPIELSGRLSVQPDELKAAQIEPLCDTGSVDITLRLEWSNGAVRYAVRQFTFADGLDATGAGTPKDQLRFVQRFAVFLARNHLIHDGDDRPSFALIEETRRVKSPSGPDTVDEGGGLIPQALMRRLYKAKDSLDADRVGTWELFAELSAACFPQLGEGQFVARFDIERARATLNWETGRRRLPVQLLGSGIQQALALIGQLLTTDARLVAIEEPECNLRYDVQLRLRQVFQQIVDDPRGPTQLFMTSHSPAFEMGQGFYALSVVDGAPVVERRPDEQARAFLGVDPDLPPMGASAPLSYVTSEGLVRVPPAIRQRLGVHDGGGVVFVERDSGAVEVLSAVKFVRLLDAADEPDAP